MFLSPDARKEKIFTPLKSLHTKSDRSSEISAMKLYQKSKESSISEHSVKRDISLCKKTVTDIQSQVKQIRYDIEKEDRERRIKLEKEKEREYLRYKMDMRKRLAQGIKERRKEEEQKDIKWSRMKAQEQRLSPSRHSSNTKQNCKSAL